VIFKYLIFNGYNLSAFALTITHLLLPRRRLFSYGLRRTYSAYVFYRTDCG